MKVFHSRGFLEGKPVSRRDLPHQYDGKELDELTLTATMTSRHDVENVISYLSVHRFCFDRPEQEIDITPLKESLSD